ncbi:LOW QUALITY PROTEIN: hypothetical protein V2J09_020848 [Rumex salicifolius]
MQFQFPTSYYECKKVIKDLSLGYEKIDSCPNDCIFDLSRLDSFPTCKASRWKKAKGREEDKKRLKRLYMSSKTAKNMDWMLRHLADEYLCSTTLDIHELDAMKEKIIMTLCEMRKLFLPTFFTIMVHLLLHLVEEVKLGGLNPYRWIYPIKRYVADLKSYVTNKAQPKGSIAEGYILEETKTFCLRYLEGFETILSNVRLPYFGTECVDMKRDEGYPVFEDFILVEK